DDVAHVHHHDERRPPFVAGQSAHVGFGLAAGAEHDVIPAPAAAPAVALAAQSAALGCRLRERFAGFLRLDALLGFQHEAAAFVEVDVAARLGAVRVREEDGFLEYIGVALDLGARRIGAGHAEDAAELGEENLVVGPLGPAGPRP